MDKCANIPLGNSQKSLRFGKDVIKSASVQSGLTFSNDLKWNLHIENACLKAFRDFHSISRIASDGSVKLNLYNQMIVPVFVTSGIRSKI